MDRRRVILGAAGGLILAQAGRAGADTPLFSERIAAGAEAQVGVTTLYDPSYVRLAYPMGDVPADRGVCTDVVVRAFRTAGVDLQAEVHRDMAAHFRRYPRDWGLARPDRNIDHRRVPNLETFFRRRGAAREISTKAEDYLRGDVVSWRLYRGGTPHIAIVTQGGGEGERGAPILVHNIGAGARAEAVLFDWPITGWFRFSGWA